jgi:hypothetical protein
MEHPCGASKFASGKFHLIPCQSGMPTASLCGQSSYVHSTQRNTPERCLEPLPSCQRTPNHDEIQSRFEFIRGAQLDPLGIPLYEASKTPYGQNDQSPKERNAEDMHGSAATVEDWSEVRVKLCCCVFPANAGSQRLRIVGAQQSDRP